MPPVADTVAAAPTLCVDVKRAAEILSVSEWTVRAWLAGGQIPVIRFPSVDGAGVNRRILVRVADLEAFVARHVERS
ncbi:MAG: helix-turn-helix domain-containing protein [Vicinamibacterales bacterium]